jgi:hypothetical protein
MESYIPRCLSAPTAVLESEIRAKFCQDWMKPQIALLRHILHAIFPARDGFFIGQVFIVLPKSPISTFFIHQ